MKTVTMEVPLEVPGGKQLRVPFGAEIVLCEQMHTFEGGDYGLVWGYMGQEFRKEKRGPYVRVTIIPPEKREEILKIVSPLLRGYTRFCNPAPECQ